MKLCLIGLILACVTGIHAQTPEMRQRNRAYLDSAETVIRDVWCKGQMQYKSHYSKRFIRRALAMVQVMNDISGDSFMLEDLDKVLRKMKTRVWKKTELPKGKVNVLSFGTVIENFTLKVRLESIDGLIVGKDYYISQKTYCNCNGSPQSIQDFPLMKRLLAEHAVFAVQVMDYHDYIYFRRLVYPNLSRLADTKREYRFVYDLKEGDRRINRLLQEQYIYDRLVYNPERPDQEFAMLISKGKDRLIMDLLYSPNYFYAVNAMESLIYLASMGRVTIDDSLKARIDTVREANYDIEYAVSDVISIRAGYKALHMTDGKVIDKYVRYFKEHPEDEK